MKVKKILMFSVVALLAMASMSFCEDPFMPMKISYSAMLNKWIMNLGWILVASLGFGLGTGIAIKIFDLISTDINEWEEVKKGNMGVVAILVSIIVMVGIIVVVSII
ncbi:MAG: hypothetical protein A2Y40_07175 [Candidatus Margulisbacteria bacterium GWF2_35_9]|nr:MAG: hypothetical protein A2Y40_07175 [Candidatus Margulisbacteria bacterium GWF2_35_9]